eukprot:GILI01009052.1.p1 GENE.GILI01009052.1~~GILI01009052.1.p1  ORF type:complete len:433 (-),score=144.38 GILI01009052.1:147-1445(-)
MSREVETTKPLIDSGAGEDGIIYEGYNLQGQRSFIQRTFTAVEPGSVRGSIFTLASTAIGAGILALPYVLNVAGFAMGIGFLVLGAVISWVSIQMLVTCVRKTGITSYAELVRYVYGPKMGLVLETVVVVYCFGCVIGYFVLIGTFLPTVLKAMDLSSLAHRELDMIVVICGVSLPLAFMRNFSSLRYSSLFGILMIFYLAFAIAFESSQYISADVFSKIPYFRFNMDLFSALSITFFAYTCHVNVFSVYAELHNPLPRRVAKVTSRSVYVEILLYSFLAIFGFLSFPVDTPDNITTAYPNKDWAMLVGRLGVTLVLVMAVPLNVHPCRTNLNSLLFKSTTVDNTKHVIVTVALVLSALTLAIFIPGIKVVFSLLGGTCCIFLCYLLPGFLYMKLNSDTYLCAKNIPVLIMVVVCAVVGVMSTALTLASLGK